ncbi:MAG TPA: hypothetical protein VK933_15995 [Longimicrobiales bacterium]|nr:hypothetical protein [Longimicrobiales bacterium]
MILRGAGRAIAGLALVAAVSACDDNPLSENRDSAEYFRLSVSNAVVEVGGQIGVVANVLNQYGAALVVNVTAAECDARVTVAVDPVRSEYEYPERFIITGNTVGESCVVVSGGGITDTIDVRVVPAAVDVTIANQVIASGSTAPLSVTYAGATGASAGGVTFNPAHTTFTVANGLVVSVDADGNVSGQAPGTTWVRAVYTDLGVTRRDSVEVTVVAGTFTGTVTQGTDGNATGSIGTAVFTEGAVAFDSDTQVILYLDDEVIRTHLVPGTSSTQIEVVLPFGLPAGSIDYEIINMGPNQIAAAGTIDLPAGTPAADAFEPDATIATPKAIVPGERLYGSLNDPGDTRDLVRLTITTAGDYRVSLGWNDTSDHDFYVRNTANNGTLLSLEGGVTSNPETGVVTLAVGTYWLRADVWTHDPIGGRPSTYYMTVVQQ